MIMILSKSWDDKYGYFHNRYQHFYKGIKVEGSEFTEHYTKGKVEIAHGKIAEDLNTNVIPTLNENAALDAALDAIGADIYAWQDTDWEAAIKLDANDENATYFPTGKLVITPLQWNNDYTPSNFVLAWTFTIKALSPANTTEIYINAHTGDVIRNQSIARNNGPAETLYYGTQTIDTEWRGFPHNNHRLKTTNNGRNIHTKSGTFADNFYLTSNETDNDDIWGTNQAGETTAHWVVSQSWDYFLDVHGRGRYG
jgi:bacillolysin